MEISAWGDWQRYGAREVRFAAGDTLARAGEPFTRLCLLTEGRAKVYNMMENGRAVMHVLYGGMQLIGDLELLLQYPTLTSDVQAVTDGRMLVIALTERNRAEMLEDAAMLRVLGREVAAKLERNSRMSTQAMLYPLSARLAAFLLYAQENRLVSEPLTRISELMGASYRHLLRVIREFCENGWLEKAAGGYRITDEAALRQLGEPLRYD